MCFLRLHTGQNRTWRYKGYIGMWRKSAIGMGRHGHGAQARRAERPSADPHAPHILFRDDSPAYCIRSLFGFLLQLECFFKKLSIVGAVPRPPWPPVSHPRALAKAFIYNINRVDAIHGALKSMVPISLIPLSGNLLSGERRAHRAHRLAARPA